jgi:hypothetical protein
MPGSEPVSDRPALWAALSHMQIVEPGTGRRFEEALAEANGWTLDFAERVADEYCGFLYLAATAGVEVTPSETVDRAWHLHLEWPHYRDVLCRQMIGRPLEHRPGTGEPGDEVRCRRQYEETLALYERVFGKLPPADIWPSPFADEEEDALEEARGRGLSRRLSFGSLVGALAASALGAPAFGFAFAGAALLFFLLGQPSVAGGAPHDRKSGNCGGGGGSCGGGGGAWSSSDDCGASCGGASCGGASCGGASCGGGGCGGGCGGS